MKAASRQWSAVRRSVYFIVLCAMLFALCVTAQAQQPAKIPRIGYLGGGSAELEKVWLDAFLQGLRELGYFEGKNIVVERRYAAGRYDQLPELAAELIRLKVDVILPSINSGPSLSRGAESKYPKPVVSEVEPSKI